MPDDDDDCATNRAPAVEPVAFNVGLFGHVDSGKTAIARVLTDVVSTAGLDAHPQSKRRGITIDLGFTFFHLDGYLVTLVDAPGHADLVQSVVSAARIIDAAVVVVDAKEGPQVQTGEHLVVLESLGVTDVAFALNKVDLLAEDQVASRVDRVREVVADTPYRDAPVVPVSAVQRRGFDALKEALRGLLHPPARDVDGPFLLPVDHHFPVRGEGTVVTGTVLRGTLSVGDAVRVVPLGVNARVKSIQVAKERRPRVTAGNRAGVAVAGLPADRLERGHYLTTDPACVPELRVALVSCRISRFFSGSVKFGLQVHATVGMTTLPALLFPVRVGGERAFAVEEVGPRAAPSGLPEDRTFDAVLVLREPAHGPLDSPVLLSRFDLPPTTLRVMGAARVERVMPAFPPFYRVKAKFGKVKNPDHPKGVVVTGLFQSKQGARKYLGVRTKEPAGRILDTFGTKGDVIVELESAATAGTDSPAQRPAAGDPVLVEVPWQFRVPLPDWGVPTEPVAEPPPPALR
ncbi:MAG: selenocysteine-specific translation elongation factor [Promethearchaeota archaeon]